METKKPTNAAELYDHMDERTSDGVLGVFARLEKERTTSKPPVKPAAKTTPPASKGKPPAR